MNNRNHISGKSNTLKEYANVDDTIKAIKRIVLENYHTVTNLTDLLQGRCDEDTFRNIWNYVRSNVRYQNDEKGKEQLRRPQRTLHDKTGDCDDMSILISSILTNFGYYHELYITAYKTKNKWQHIYPVVFDNEGNRFVIDCVPEIPYFNYEAKPIKNKKIIPMKLEELGEYNHSIEAEMINELTEPFEINSLAGVQSEDDELSTIQGLLGNVALVGEDDDYDTMLSGSVLKQNIILRQLAEAKTSLENEIRNPTDLSQLNDNKTELILIREIIINFEDEELRDEAIDIAIDKGTLFANFYKAIKYGINDAVNGLSGEEDDVYYLKVLDNEGMLDDMLDEDDLSGDLGRGFFKKLKNKIKKKVSNFKKKHPKLAKIGHALKKFSPATFGIRRSLGLFFRANAFQLSEKIAIGYASESKARQMGYSKAEWLQFVDGKNKAESKWHSLGGEKSQFKKIIMEGRGASKAGLKGELGIAPAIVAAVTKVFGVVIKVFKKLKLKKQAQKDAANQNSGSRSKSTTVNEDFDMETAQPENVETDEKSGVVAETITDENGKQTKVYKDKEGNEINRYKAFFLKNKTMILIISIVLVVGIIGLIIWKVRQRSLSGLGSTGISSKQANYIRRQGLNNRAYASLVREEISKDGQNYNKTNRKKYYKDLFRESYSKPLSDKQVNATQRFNEMRKEVVAEAKGGGSAAWKDAWKKVKKKF